MLTEARCCWGCCTPGRGLYQRQSVKGSTSADQAAGSIVPQQKGGAGATLLGLTVCTGAAPLPAIRWAPRRGGDTSPISAEAGSWNESPARGLNMLLAYLWLGRSGIAMTGIKNSSDSLNLPMIFTVSGRWGAWVGWHNGCQSGFKLLATRFPAARRFRSCGIGNSACFMPGKRLSNSHTYSQASARPRAT
jgi:hypothetical protein